MSRESWKIRTAGIKALLSSAPPEVAMNHIVSVLEYLLDVVLESAPPGGEKKRVTNLYVEMVEGNPKLRVEYEE